MTVTSREIWRWMVGTEVVREPKAGPDYGEEGVDEMARTAFYQN